MKLRIPLGTSDFRLLREQGLEYVDKSLLIREIIEDSSAVILLPRPGSSRKTLDLPRRGA